jgi:putative oxidoreductase
MQLSTLLRSSVATTDSVAPLFLRLALGAMILPHGLQKTLGWFGGYGFAGTMQYFTQSFGAPWLLALLAILAESVGGVMLLAGAGTRLAALGVGAVMAVAATQHWQHGFFMNWFGQQQGEGIEFFILALGIAAALVVTGGGRWSVDARVAR